jgi:hypothetical protein
MLKFSKHIFTTHKSFVCREGDTIETTNDESRVMINKNTNNYSKFLIFLKKITIYIFTILFFATINQTRKQPMFQIPIMCAKDGTQTHMHMCFFSDNCFWLFFLVLLTKEIGKIVEPCFFFPL